MSGDVDLEHCPVCGSRAVSRVRHDGQWFNGCDRCGACDPGYAEARAASDRDIGLYRCAREQALSSPSVARRAEAWMASLSQIVNAELPERFSAEWWTLFRVWTLGGKRR